MQTEVTSLGIKRVMWISRRRGRINGWTEYSVIYKLFDIFPPKAY